MEWNSAESLIKLSEKFAEWLNPFPFPACTACAAAAVDKRALEWIAVVCVCSQFVCECVWTLNTISTLPSAADVFSSPAPILSSAPPPKIGTGAVLDLFGGG